MAQSWTWVGRFMTKLALQMETVLAHSSKWTFTGSIVKSAHPTHWAGKNVLFCHMPFAHTTLFWSSLEILCHINNSLYIFFSSLIFICCKQAVLGDPCVFLHLYWILVFFTSCPKLSHSDHPFQPCSDFQKALAVCKAVRFLLDEKHCLNVRSLPFNILFYNCMLTVAGGGSAPLFFVSTDGRKRGADNLCTRVSCMPVYNFSTGAFLDEYQNLLIITLTTIHKEGGEGGETSKENS